MFKEAVTRKIRKYPEFKENENTTQQKLQNIAKAVFREKIM